MSCIQQNFPSKFEPNDAFYEKLEENTFVAFILKHPVVMSACLPVTYLCDGIGCAHYNSCLYYIPATNILN